jgi:hypothetical protein
MNAYTTAATTDKSLPLYLHTSNPLHSAHPSPLFIQRSATDTTSLPLPPAHTRAPSALTSPRVTLWQKMNPGVPPGHVTTPKKYKERATAAAAASASSDDQIDCVDSPVYSQEDSACPPNAEPVKAKQVASAVAPCLSESALDVRGHDDSSCVGESGLVGSCVDDGVVLQEQQQQQQHQQQHDDEEPQKQADQQHNSNSLRTTVKVASWATRAKARAASDEALPDKRTLRNTQVRVNCAFYDANDHG